MAGGESGDGRQRRAGLAQLTVLGSALIERIIAAGRVVPSRGGHDGHYRDRGYGAGSTGIANGSELEGKTLGCRAQQTESNKETREGVCHSLCDSAENPLMHAYFRQVPGAYPTLSD